MKTLQQLTKYALISLLIIAGTSCSKDDDSGGNDGPQLQGGADHEYSLTFSGGQFDGETKSGTIPNDASAAVVSAYIQNPQNSLELSTFTISHNGIGINGSFTRSGGQSSFSLSDDYAEEGESGSSIILTIPGDDGTPVFYVSQSGTLSISNFQTFDINGPIGISYYSMTFEGVFEIGDTEEMIMISGSLVINPPA